MDLYSLIYRFNNFFTEPCVIKYFITEVSNYIYFILEKKAICNFVI